MAPIDEDGAAPALGVGLDGARLRLAEGDPVLWRGPAFIRVHAAVGSTGDAPLRGARGDRALVVALVAGAGPVAVTPARVVAVLRPTAARSAVAVGLGWDEVDDVSPSAHGGVLLLSTTLLGGLTLDPVRS